MDDAWPEPGRSGRRSSSLRLPRSSGIACVEPLARGESLARRRDETNLSPSDHHGLGRHRPVRDPSEPRQGRHGRGLPGDGSTAPTQQTVALKVVREESRMPGDDEALRQELAPRAARSATPTSAGSTISRPAPGEAHPGDGADPRADPATHIRKKKAQGGYTADEFPSASPPRSAQGLAAIHAQGLVHGDLKPGNVMVSEGRTVILDFGFAQERAPRLGAPPRRPAGRRHAEATCPRSASCSGGASAEDDRVYAMALTLWEMLDLLASPSPGCKPRAKTMASQIMFDVPAGRRSTAVKADLPRVMTQDPQMAPQQARHMRFFNPTQLTNRAPSSSPRERLRPTGPPLGRGAAAAFIRRARSRSSSPTPPTRPRWWARCSRSTSRSSPSVAAAIRIWSSPRPPSPAPTRCCAGSRAPGSSRTWAALQRQLRRPQLRAQRRRSP